MIGQTISHYKIFEKLGEGGMGVVYKAQDTKLNRIVALKFLPASLAASKEDAERFQQEAEAVSALNHPHIGTIHDIGEIDGKQFLVLEYIPGGTLRSTIKKIQSAGTELSIVQILDYGIQMADGLGHAHRHHIIHRDLKTDNVMLTAEGTLKLTDFGLAKLRGAAQLTRTGSTLGTAAYMSPEQMRGEEVDNRSDLFSLGVVLYEITTLHLPFRGEHEAALAYSIVHEDPMDIKLSRKDAPEDLEKIINRCLEKDPSKRYQNAEEIVADLQLLKEGSAGHVQTIVKHSKVPWIAAAAIVLLGVLAVYIFAPSSRPTSANRKTIAVLPLNNLSGDPNYEYFSDGIAEDILTQLSKIADLNVIAMTSVIPLKGTKKTIRDIGKQLHADVVLAGSVQREGDQVRITAQLIDASTNGQLWAETYTKEYKQVFDIQSDVSRKIVTALNAKLSPASMVRSSKEPTDNFEAYNLYLKGRFFWNQRTPTSSKKGLDFFQQAIDLDSTYAVAYSGLADCYTFLGYGSFLAPADAFPKAKAAALKALQLDSTLAEPHASLGYFDLYYDRNWKAAEKEFQTAIALNPNYGLAYDWYGTYLTAMERLEEARTMFKKALDIDPLSVPFRTDLGFTLYYGGHYDEAIKEFKACIEMNPKSALSHLWLGRTYQQKKMYDEANVEYKKTFEGIPDWTVGLAAMGYVYGVSGGREEALKTLDHLKSLSSQKYVTSYGVALIYTGLGDKDQAFEWLNKAFDKNENWLVWLKLDPRWTPLRSDARFVDLVRRVGLPL